MPTLGANAIDGIPATAWEGPIIDIVNQLQDTTIDLVLAGHTHRIANTVVGHIPVAEGVNAGGSYSVAQLMVRDGDVAWVSPATRVAKNLGVAPRADVQAIVDQANADTAVLRNQVIGTQAFDILRDPTRLHESAMGNMVADAMRASTRASRRRSPTRAGCGRTCGDSAVRRRSRQRDHVGRGLRRAAVRQPHGDRDDHRDAADGRGAERPPARCATRRSPGTGRFPQVSGIQITYTCYAAPRRSIVTVWKRRTAAAAHADRSDGRHPYRHQRLHVLRWRRRVHGLVGGADVLVPGDALIDLTIGYIAGHSPVSPVIDGRTVGP